MQLTPIPLSMGIWSAHRASADLIAGTSMPGFAHEDRADQDAAVTACRALPPTTPFASGSMPTPYPIIITAANPLLRCQARIVHSRLQ
jgi:hypothetical protein